MKRTVAILAPVLALAFAGLGRWWLRTSADAGAVPGGAGAASDVAPAAVPPLAPNAIRLSPPPGWPRDTTGDLRATEATLDRAIEESGLEDALIGCPPPTFLYDESQTTHLVGVELDLWFAGEGLVDAQLVGVTGGVAEEETLQCYRDVVWELAWPAFDPPVKFRGRWNVAGQMELSPEGYADWRARRVAAGLDPDATDLGLTMRTVGPDGQPTGPSMKMIPPRP